MRTFFGTSESTSGARRRWWRRTLLTPVSLADPKSSKTENFFCSEGISGSRLSPLQKGSPAHSTAASKSLMTATRGRTSRASGRADRIRLQGAVPLFRLVWNYRTSSKDDGSVRRSPGRGRSSMRAHRAHLSQPQAPPRRAHGWPPTEPKAAFQLQACPLGRNPGSSGPRLRQRDFNGAADSRSCFLAEARGELRREALRRGSARLSSDPLHFHPLLKGKDARPSGH